MIVLTQLIAQSRNYHLLPTTSSKPQWLTIPNGSSAYTDAVMRGFPSNHRFLKTTVRSVTNDEDGRVQLHLESGKSEVYDHVILATHGDEAYSIIRGSATPDEKQVMSKFRTSESIAVLHSDVSLMPQSRKTWSSWNHLTRSTPGSDKHGIDQVSVTCNLNILQHIPRDVFGDVLVTVNPLDEPDPETVQGRYRYRLPLYDADTIRAQHDLQRIQNTRGISYAGAWTRYGSHEDGFSSGLYVAREHLGARLPFPLKDSAFHRFNKPELGIFDLFLRLIILIIHVVLIEIVDRVVRVYRAKTSRQRPLVKGVSGGWKQKKVR